MGYYVQILFSKIKIYVAFMDIDYNFTMNDEIGENLVNLIENPDYTLKNFVYDLIIEPDYSFKEFLISDDELNEVLLKFVENNEWYFPKFNTKTNNVQKEFLNSFEEHYITLKKEHEKQIMITMNNIPIDLINNSLNDFIRVSDQVMRIYDSPIINQTIEMMSLQSQMLSQFDLFVKTMPPIDLIKKLTLTSEALTRVHESFNLINWNQINLIANTAMQTLANINLNLIIIEKGSFVRELYSYVCESDDDWIKSVFTLDFIRKIVFNDWWIIPTIDKEYYEELSKMDDENFNQFFLNHYYDDPNLIIEKVNGWRLSDIRRTVIEQAIFNYMNGKYEAAVIILTLQLEGILKDELGVNKMFGGLRKSLENKLNQYTNEDSWKKFLNNANIKFISEILKPLGDKINFKEDIGQVNRNGIAHTGVVDANQIVALRLIFIIDTLIYITENL